ncbi:PCMD domain-containing protein [Gaetbulibacter saemankumensis]|uniref:PCMD domain-containing protein n=1 Tax=Gaetbulibacter saemankumensis TaxID=311208 RepID=UPI0004877968|nr:PCMD domain-containing protein [Gaetbulibacter saemankumensis]
MGRIKSILLLTCSGLIMLGCIKEDYFGASPFGNIKQILVSNQSGNATIISDSLLVTVEIPGGVDLTEITIETLEISSFAKANKDQGDLLNLENDDTIQIIAEDGSAHNWTIRAFVASETPQLDNNDLNAWYKTATNYYEPGESAANTIWGSSNPGTQLLNKLATIPEDLGNDNLAAKLITLDMGDLAATFGTPIAAGSIFTGYFDSDNIQISDPQAAIVFGTPFAGRPAKLRFKYSFIPGPENKNKQGELLDFSDACDIYALLEFRQGGETQRLATAWFRSDQIQEEFMTQEVVFYYGALDNSFPDYMFPPDGQNFVNDDIAQYGLPTHITFVASSSFDGANFAGAIGSTLIIDDIEMVYE